MDPEEDDEEGGSRNRSSGWLGITLLGLGVLGVSAFALWFFVESFRMPKNAEEIGAEVVVETNEAPAVDSEFSIPDDRPAVITDEPVKKPVRDKAVMATVDSLETELRFKPRIVRFVIMRDHSASQTSRDQKLSASLIDSIMAGVYDPNKITVYQFGTSVRPIGTAENASERRQLRSDWKAFVPSSGWAYSDVTRTANDRRPLDDQFTNLTGLFSTTLPSIRDFAQDSEYVCVIVLTDGVNQPPFRRGHPGELLEDESHKRGRINATLASIQRDSPNNVEFHVIEIGLVKKPGSVVEDILGGIGTTHQASSWATVAPVVAEIQRHCQGVFWWEKIPESPVEFPLVDRHEAEPFGQFLWRASGPGKFRFEAISLDPLVVADLSGSVLVNGETLVEFGQPVLLNDQSTVEFTVFIKPDDQESLPSNYFSSVKLEYLVRAVPVGNSIPFLPRQKSADEIPTSPIYPHWFSRHWFGIKLSVGILAGLLFLRIMQVRRQYRRLGQVVETSSPSEIEPLVLKGKVVFQDEEIVLHGMRQQIGNLNFRVTPEGVSILFGNDMEFRSDPDDEPATMRAGFKLERQQLKGVFTDIVFRDQYDVTVLTHHQQVEEEG